MKNGRAPRERSTTKKKSIRTEWNLKLLYASEKDPAIEQDVKAVETACEKFEKKYRETGFTKNPKALRKALDDFERVRTLLVNSKADWYFGLITDIDANNSFARGAGTKIDERLSKATNKIAFFTLEIGKIAKKNQEKFLKSTDLKPYAETLRRIFERAQFNLSEKEEQLEDLLSQTSYTLWVDGQEQFLAKQTIPHRKKELPIGEATSILADLPKQERRKLHQAITEKMKSVSHFAEAELNAIYNYKKTMDELRGLEKPYSATVLGYDNDMETVENLVSLVTKHFTISKNFYKLHAKLLKEKRLSLADRSVHIGKVNRTFDFAASVDIVRGAFEKVDPKYAQFLDTFLSNGQIDVYPRKGKTSGAYCSSTGNQPTFVLLNHTNDLRSVETLAHEMGHAIHSELSKSQPTRYQHYSTAVAEVASTFFEQLVGDAIEETLTEKEKVILLHNRLMGDIATIFRQIAFFNFERELHERVRAEGQVSKEEIAKLMAKHLRAYLGPTFEIADDEGYFFVYLSHIRRFFYVYSYAYGQMISRALYERWKKDPSYAKEIEFFLSAGKSMSPQEIFKHIGIDTSDPAFFKEALEGIARDIKRLEKLTR